MFTADSMFEGGAKVLKVLKKNRIKGSFFFTGNFLRMMQHRKITGKIIKEGHYVGAHSDRHVLYAPWDNRDKSLLSPDSLINDVKENYRELEKFGVYPKDAKWFIPPYEWYNKESVELVSRLGLVTFNYTPGTATPADYTTPDMRNYKSSQQLMDALFGFEQKKGLGGAFILIHPGTENSRTDKLYNNLDVIIGRLKELGYEFDRL
ncbi:MAG: polysaccharide deacetylase family protein [Bacteroidales bacterium]